jgi:cation:H+ antiporter
LAFHSGLLKRELPALMLISILCYVLALDGLSFVDGIIMLVALALFLFWLVSSALAGREKDVLAQEMEAEIPESMPNRKAWIYSPVMPNKTGKSRLITVASTGPGAIKA